MRAVIEDFIRALRTNGVEVSVAEAIEAHKMLAHFGFADHALLRTGLGQLLAKSEAEKDRFADVFDLFFAQDPLLLSSLGITGSKKGDEQEDGQNPSTAQEDAASQSPSQSQSGASASLAPSLPDGVAGDNALAAMILEGDGQGLSQQLSLAAQQTGANMVRFSTQRGVAARKLLDQMGLSELEALIARVDAGEIDGLDEEESSRLVARLQAGRTDLIAQTLSFMDRQIELYAKPNQIALREATLSTMPLTSIPHSDYDRMHKLVTRLADKLASRYVKRRKRARRGILDVRRTMRANMGHDGVPFITHWKQTKIDRPRLVVVCDVSRSVANTARFLLLFLYSLHEVVRDIHSFAFASQTLSIDAMMDDHDIEDAIPKVLSSIGFQPTDYGQMLRSLKRDHWSLFDRRTCVIFLGDGRSNYGEAEVPILKELYDRCGRIIWINPERQNQWGNGDSEMKRYAPHCHVAESCNSLSKLERIVDDFLKAVF
ncbi:MAG: VWA domain-containing protein [Cohaesibacter sp.]|jgi:uncharacterized protein with von Willebrand factor type A (vWA) domain|nr:VWA domain-containing protein [Cohaesibacter sp.]